MLTVAICVPTRGAMNRGFVYDLVRLMIYTEESMVLQGLGKAGVLFGEGTYIHRNREDLAELALAEGATHLLWLDDDMRFPPDLLRRLLAHKKPIVGVNYSTRGTEARPVTVKKIGEKHWPAERLYSDETSTGLESVDGIGFGAVLIEAPVFDKITRPWFENYYDRERDRWVGEDIDFCIKARAAGYEVLIDHDLSKEMAHIGLFEYTMEHACALREQLKGVPDGAE